MNKVYESDTMVVHDDREPITLEQAFDILWEGKSIRICFPPDYTAENESDIFDDDYPIFLSEILNLEMYQNINKYKDTQIKDAVYQYLHGYELYR